MKVACKVIFSAAFFLTVFLSVHVLAKPDIDPVFESAGSLAIPCTDLVIDDYNSGPPNNLGGGRGPWSPQPGSCYTSLSAGQSGNPEDFGEAMGYDVMHGFNEYCGMWNHLGPIPPGGMNVPTPFNGSRYKSLSFYLKGNPSSGFTQKFIAELKNADESGQYSIPHPYLIQGVTDEWQHFRIPLVAFTDGLDKTRLTEFVTVFQRNYSNPQIGEIAIDQLTLSCRGTDLLMADFQIDWPDSYGGSIYDTNNLRGRYGLWHGFPDDSSQGCGGGNAAPDVFGNPDGRSLSMSYDVESPNVAYCGFYMTLGPTSGNITIPLDASDFRNLKFYVNSPAGFIHGLKIELKRANGDVTFQIVDVNGAGWQEVSLPLDGFFSRANRRDLVEFVITFANGNPDTQPPVMQNLLVDHVRMTVQ